VGGDAFERSAGQESGQLRSSPKSLPDRHQAAWSGADPRPQEEHQILRLTDDLVPEDVQFRKTSAEEVRFALREAESC